MPDENETGAKRPPLLRVAGGYAVWGDFIQDFMEYTEQALSPELFRLWSGIALVAGALERRVWVATGPRKTYPNLYTLLVAPPGVGKYTVEEVRELWMETCIPGTKSPAFKVAPDSMTKASLVDNLARAGTSGLELGTGKPYEYHSLLVAAEEFSVLLPSYDLEFIGALNSIYNNKDSPYSESRRTGTVREVSISQPQLNILGGAQPGWLASVFPEEAWSTGLTSRMIMVYCSETPLKDIFEEGVDNSGLRRHILAQLGKLSQLQGQAQWTPEAAEHIRQWHLAGGPPTPVHSKLTHYIRRRTQHALKLCLISAVARTGRLVLELQDVERGLGWLFAAEALMPDIFRAMVGRSDIQILEELHYYMMATWKATKEKPIHERNLVSFLSQRVPSDRVLRMLEVAERSGFIERYAGESTYRPRPRGNASGIE